MAKNDAHCSFCGTDRKNVGILIAGVSGHICDACAKQAVKIVAEEEKVGQTIQVTAITKDVMKPMELKSKLDNYIIGQEAAKKILSVAIR